MRIARNKPNLGKQENDVRGKKSSENSTIIRLRETPFKTAAEMNAEENRIMREEWEILERARRRRLLFKKEQFREIVAPYTNGFGARFVQAVDAKSSANNLVKAYLTDKDEVQIDIDDKLNSEDAGSTINCLVKSVTESLMNSYMGTTLGLKEDLDLASKQPIKMQEMAQTPQGSKKNAKTKRPKK